MLNPKYTFEEFIVDAGNQAAFQAAIRVAENPGKVSNPLIISGDVGSGKTHLSHAIGNRIRQNSPTFKLLFTSSEDFLRRYLTRKKEKPKSFIKEYENLDVLSIENINFLRDKPAAQKELFHIILFLRKRQRQLILDSQEPLEDISLNSRVLSILNKGCHVKINPLSTDGKLSILHKKAEAMRMLMPHSIAYWLAEKTTNIRELEGYVIRLSAHSELSGTPITFDIVKNLVW